MYTNWTEEGSASNMDGEKEKWMNNRVEGGERPGLGGAIRDEGRKREEGAGKGAGK